MEHSFCAVWYLCTSHRPLWNLHSVLFWYLCTSHRPSWNIYSFHSVLFGIYVHLINLPGPFIPFILFCLLFMYISSTFLEHSFLSLCAVWYLCTCHRPSWNIHSFHSVLFGVCVHLLDLPGTFIPFILCCLLFSCFIVFYPYVFV